jgi:hypothetical protein
MWVGSAHGEKFGIGWVHFALRGFSTHAYSALFGLFSWMDGWKILDGAWMENLGWTWMEFLLLMDGVNSY